MQPLVVLRQQLYNLLQQQNRLQHQPTVHLWMGLSFEEGEEVNQKEIFLQREETGHKANPADVAPKMKRLR